MVRIRAFCSESPQPLRLEVVLWDDLESVRFPKLLGLPLN